MLAAGCPLMAVTMSPTCTPALCAGLPAQCSSFRADQREGKCPSRDQLRYAYQKAADDICSIQTIGSWVAALCAGPPLQCTSCS